MIKFWKKKQHNNPEISGENQREKNKEDTSTVADLFLSDTGSEDATTDDSYIDASDIMDLRVDGGSESVDESTTDNQKYDGDLSYTGRHRLNRPDTKVTDGEEAAHKHTLKPGTFDVPDVAQPRVVSG